MDLGSKRPKKMKEIEKDYIRRQQKTKKMTEIEKDYTRRQQTHQISRGSKQNDFGTPTTMLLALSVDRERAVERDLRTDTQGVHWNAQALWHSGTLRPKF